MFTLDDRLKGLPALKEQVESLHQSLNTPHLAIPGRKAGTAQAFVVGLKGPSGFAVFVYLYLTSSGECAVYVPGGGTVPEDKFPAEESDALSFVESMGFIMDNLNFQGRPSADQDGMIKSLPVFQRSPPAPGAAPGGSGDASAPSNGAGKGGVSVSALGKLFAAFALSVVVMGCAHVITEREKEQAQIRYDLAVQQLVQTPQAAFKEIEIALSLNPEHAEAWHVRGILLHNAFGLLDDALKSYQRAIKLKPKFSEAHTNLGNLYADMKRYDEAISEYDVALTDVLYSAPFIAHGNKGWAFYRKGEMRQAVESLQSALASNPKYCMGHRQLATIYEEQNQIDDALKHYGRYREYCPDYADAYEREGLLLAKNGRTEPARKSLEQCVSKASDDMKDRCQKALQALGGTP